MPAPASCLVLNGKQNTTTLLGLSPNLRGSGEEQNSQRQPMITARKTTVLHLALDFLICCIGIQLL